MDKQQSSYRAPTSDGPRGDSKTQNTAVGSGSRPYSGKINIPTSCPSDPKNIRG